MPLVTPIDARSAPLLVRDLFADGADPGPIAATLAHVPELCEVALPFLGTALSPTDVDVRLKEIAIVRTSANLACRYCTDTHTVVGADAGLSVDELRALRREAPVDGVFTDQVELALLDWIDALAGPTGPVDPYVAARAKLLLGDHRLVDLTVTVGATMLLNRFATALRLPVSPEARAVLAALGLDVVGDQPADVAGTGPVDGDVASQAEDRVGVLA